MTASLSITVDVEDHRPHLSVELRFDRATVRIAEWLTGRGARGTFFTVGDVARRWPHVVREVAALGHEIGLHGWEHRPLAEVGHDRLAGDARAGRELLEDLAGAAVRGFRAPQFSLVADCTWAADALADAGFTYSSSVLPAPSPLFGFPGAPDRPFRWPSGLVELPSPVVGQGPLRVPIGGLYLRVLPMTLLRRWADDAAVGPAGWLYLHPYDVDPGERFWVVRDANPLLSPLQWWHRDQTFDRIATLTTGRTGGPLGDVADGLDRASLAVFDR